MTSIPPVVGRYEVLSQIGRGEMGALYQAWDPQLARPIAIKILTVENVELRERFKRDACAVTDLRHPHLVTIFDVGADEGRPFVAMEYIQGRTLADLIGSHEPISTLRTLQLMQELCDGLAFAHHNGIIHRDITPADIMVDGNGILKILHFGIAPFATATTTTQSGALLLAVGAVFYELLGRPAGVRDLGSLDPLMQFEPEPLETLLPAVDPDIVAIVRRCLEKDPILRYPSLDAIRTDLRRALVHLQSAGEPGMDATERPPHVSAEPIPAPEPTRRILDREELARRRSRQIELHLERAELALSAGDYDAGIDACEEVLLLDAENAPALELMDRARIALDQRQAEDWLDEAENEIQRGALSTAVALVQSAAMVAPSLARVAEVRRHADEAIEERERAKQRAEHEQRARDIVREARHAFGAGNHEEALQLLARFAPPHDLVTHAGEELRAEADRIAEQKRREAEHRARQQRIRAAVAMASDEISQEQFVEAVERLRALEHAEGPSSEIAVAIAAAEAGQAEADRKAALQQELSEHVARAAGLLARNQAAAAISRVDAALAIDPHYTPAVALKAKVQDALQRIAQRREIDERLARERAQANPGAIETAQFATSHEQAHAGADLETARDLTTQAHDPDSESVDAQLLLEGVAHFEEFEALHPTATATREDESRALEQVFEEFAEEHPTATAIEHQTLPRDDSPAIRLVTSESSANVSVMPQRRMPNVAASASAPPRPAPATGIASVPRVRSPRRWMRAAALGAIAVAGGVYYVTSGQSSLQGEAAVTVARTPVPPEASVPLPTPPVAAETPAVRADREAELDHRVGELHTRARQAFGRGDWQEGFIAVAEAAQLRPDNAASNAILADALQDVRTRATEARAAARAAGSPERSPAFRAAARKQGEGDRLARGGKTNEGIRALWETVGLFQIARAEAVKSRERPQVAASGRDNAALRPTGSLPAPTIPPASAPTTTDTPPAAESTANRPPPAIPSLTVAPPAPTAPARPPAAEPSAVPTPPRSDGTASPPPVGNRPSATPTANAPLSPAAALAQERPGIQTTLEAYASGYSTLDAAAIKRIYPGIDENGLRKRFSAYRSQQVQVQVEQIQMSGPTTADVSTLQTTAASMQVGGPQRDTRRIVFRLEKRNGSWIILEHR